MNNAEIVEVLEQTASLLEYRDKNSYFTNEIRSIASIVSRLEIPLEVFQNAATDRSDRQELDRMIAYWFGRFSPESLDNLQEVILSGTSRLREHLLREISPSVVGMLRLKSLDIPMIDFLRNQLNIRNTATLRKACSERYLSGISRLSEQEELDLLEEIILLETDTVSAKHSKDQEILIPAIEPDISIDSEKTMFGANADALADFIISELQQPHKYSSLKASVSDFVSSETIDVVKKRTQNIIGRVGRFFTSHKERQNQNFEYDRFPREENNLDSNQPLSIEKVGSVRRGNDIVTRLSFLIETNDIPSAFERVKKSSFVSKVVYEGARSLKAILRPDSFVMPFNNRPTPEIELDFYCASDFVYGAHKVLLTSSRSHWNELKKRATSRGYTLTPFGLYKGVRRISSRTEERLYEFLDLPVIPTALREGKTEWDWLEKGSPELISVADIKGDMHMHSTYTDGANSIEEMVSMARSIGLSYIALTDHTKNVTSARGMNDIEFLRYWEFIDEFNTKLQDRGIKFKVLKGVEVDILEDGGLDLSDETLKQADWVIASIHFGKRQSQSRIHERYMDAFTNPYVDVIAHPTGRMIGIEREIEVDVDFLCQNAKKYDKCLELNSQPRRLDLCVDSLILAKKYGIPIVISTDAHAADQLPYLRFGVAQAYRAGLTNNDVLNTLSLDQLLKRRHKN